MWNARAKQWEATLEPGWVNHSSPFYRTTIVEQAEADKDFGTNPLTGKRYFSDPIFKRDTVAAQAREIEIPLYLRPAIPLRFRALGTDGLAEDAVPKYFLDRGVKRAPRLDFSTLLEAGTDVDASAPAGNVRLLRACDLILHQPRQALTSQVTLADGLGTGISNVTQTLSVRSATPGDTLRIFAGSLTIPQSIDPLARDFEEPAYDELLVSTVYLLSPRGTAPGSEPDGTWRPYVRHGLFWSVRYATPGLRILSTDPGLPYIPPLAGGAAQLIINFLTAEINDATNRALAILTAHSLAGTFWTPTGGGHDSEFPLSDPALANGSTGLDKAGRIAAQTRLRARSQRQDSLDPSFPFRALPFNPDLLAA